MRIQSLRLRDFRGFGEIRLDFPETGSTVLVGVNGSGKTSLLDAAVILLSRLEAQIRSAKGRGRQLSIDDIRIGAQSTDAELVIALNGQRIGWDATRVRKTSHLGQFTLAALKSKSANDLTVRELAGELRSRLESDEESSIPLMVFYPVNRAVLDIPLRIRKKHQFDQAAAYEGALSGGSANFRTFFEWFREREDIENERRIDDPNHRDRLLEAVRGAVEALIPGFRELRVRRKPLRMTVLKDSQEIAVQQLSDGEKCLLALTGDLARRLAIANPGLENPLLGVGIVLIDEIELHLHPNWQRRVIPALEQTFPKCQLITTTHSPAVLGHVQPDSVVLLERQGERILPRQLTTLGQDANRLLEEVFDVPARPVEFETRLRELFAEIDDGDLAAARSTVEELRATLGVDEPELIKAEAYIRRKEILGR